MDCKKVLAIVNAPDVSLSEDEKAGDILLKFYRALGWNGQDRLDPCRVFTTEAVYKRLHNIMLEKSPDDLSVAIFMVNTAPSVDEKIPAGKVYLMQGWITPEQGGDFE